MAKTEDAKRALQKTTTMSIEKLIEKSIGELGRALPSHFNKERLARLALTTLRLNPKLASCNPMSFLGALFQCAQVGLELGINGEAFLIPYGKEVVFQMGYPGWVALFYRHQSNDYLEWGEVCENDAFDYERGSSSFLSHKITGDDRGPVTHYWVMAHLKNGGTPFEVMTIADCLKHGKKHSKTFNNGPWKTDRKIMCLKTVLIQLMKIIPKSVEVQKALAMDNTIKSKISIDMSEVVDETDWDSDESKKVETEVVDESPVSDEQPEPPKRGRPKKEPVETEVSGLNDDTPPLDDEDEAIANKKRIHEKMVDEGFFDNEEAE